MTETAIQTELLALMCKPRLLACRYSAFDVLCVHLLSPDSNEKSLVDSCIRIRRLFCFCWIYTLNV